MMTVKELREKLVALSEQHDNAEVFFDGEDEQFEITDIEALGEEDRFSVALTGGSPL